MIKLAINGPMYGYYNAIELLYLVLDTGSGGGAGRLPPLEGELGELHGEPGT